MVAPVEKGVLGSDVLVTPRAAYSHSASDRSLYALPVFFESQAVYCVASCQDTLMTGCLPRPQPSSPGFCVQPLSATQASHSANVTSNLPTAKGCAKETRCWGPSSLPRPRSLSGEPIRNSPAGTVTISGHEGQSRKLFGALFSGAWYR